LSFTTRVFLWDGANSIVSRNNAAASLARQLEQLAIECPDDPIVILAHSHGGNIALRAAHIASKPSIENLRVITIATPFLQIRTYTSFYEDSITFDAPYANSVVSFLVGSIGLFLTFLMVVLLVGIGIGPWLYICIPPAVFLASKIARRLVKLIVNPFPTYRKNWGKYDTSPNGWAYQPDRLASLSFYSVPRRDSDWLLVLRGVDDEASLSLAAGAIGNRITHFFLGSFLPNVTAVFVLISFLAILITWFFGSVGDWWEQLGLVGLGWAAAIATVVLFLPGSFRTVFGRELLLGCWRCEISADSSPDTIAGVRVNTFLRPGSREGGLRHSLYANPEVAPYIATWLTASVQANKDLVD
jgi:hypothetical protein